MKGIMKLIPNDPKALRHTYAKSPYIKTNIDDSFSKTFHIPSSNQKKERGSVVISQANLNWGDSSLHVAPKDRTLSKSPFCTNITQKKNE